MKKHKQPARDATASARNGVQPDSGPRGRRPYGSPPDLRYPKTDLQRAIQRHVDLTEGERAEAIGQSELAVYACDADGLIRLDRRTPPPSRFPRADPQLILDRAELNGAESFRIPCWKRILDVTCIFLALPIWLPLMLLLMVLVRVSSPGSVFYRQERVGYRRGRFMIFKFRTMHVNAETRTHEEYFASLMRSDCPMTKLDAEGDSRLIKGGRFLRASGLDELPQIFNVLRGEMSLVGPRPCLPHEFQRYKVWQQRRFNAPPGLTGYWQVNGKNKTTFNGMIAMDLFYANNMSLWLDLTIMLKTVPALVGQMLESRRTSRPALHTHVIGRAWPATQRMNGSIGKI